VNEKIFLEILDTMNVPEERKDIKRAFNVRWLSRNIQIDNKDHPRLAEARAFITILLKRANN
jgi:hypothetical protein|tara:strand:- start:129 stop:314 length:186 start_codon:yes stop_codon:yes gene_type:complete